jgi:hypothetical protein
MLCKILSKTVLRGQLQTSLREFQPPIDTDRLCKSNVYLADLYHAWQTWIAQKTLFRKSCGRYAQAKEQKTHKNTHSGWGGGVCFLRGFGTFA